MEEKLERVTAGPGWAGLSWAQLRSAPTARGVRSGGGPIFRLPLTCPGGSPPAVPAGAGPRPAPPEGGSSRRGFAGPWPLSLRLAGLRAETSPCGFLAALYLGGRARRGRWVGLFTPLVLCYRVGTRPSALAFKYELTAGLKRWVIKILGA